MVVIFLEAIALVAFGPLCRKEETWTCATSSEISGGICLWFFEVVDLVLEELVAGGPE